jgi:hypothetical protein
MTSPSLPYGVSYPKLNFGEQTFLTFGEYPSRAQRYAPGDRERSCKRCRPR